MSSRAFYVSGWRLRALAAALRRAPVARRLLAARALAALEEPLTIEAGASRIAEEVGASPRTADDLIAAYRAGRATPREVAERALEAAAALDRRTLPLRAFLHLDADDVRAQADASAVRWREGRPIGPLDGVPIAVKDEIDVAGQPTTCGTAFLGRVPAREDAIVVARLRAAGAVIFGKTNMAELGLAPSGLNAHHGAARNPYDAERDSGGSSSGSAVAVAAGVVPIALGTDSGGSLRVPGSLTGVAALKGTFGRVPTAGIAAPFSSVLHAGALGASVRDVATAFAVLAGDDPRVARRVPLRVGICEARWREARSDVARIARRSIERLLSAGALEVAVELPDPDRMMALGLAVLGREAANAITPAVERALSPSVRVTLELARGISRARLEDARRARARVVADLECALQRVDVIVQPTTAITAPPYRSDALASGAIDEDRTRALSGATLLASLAGVPAAQVRCGYDELGLPVGVQIVAALGCDRLALEIAAEIERHIAWRRPTLWFDVLG